MLATKKVTSQGRAPENSFKQNFLTCDVKFERQDFSKIFVPNSTTLITPMDKLQNKKRWAVKEAVSVIVGGVQLPVINSNILYSPGCAYKKINESRVFGKDTPKKNRGKNGFDNDDRC